MRVAFVRRKECFSPNSVEKDDAILQAVATRMARRGCEVDILPEDDVCGKADVWLTMGRLPSTIQFLKQEERRGAVVINSGYGLERCARSQLEKVMSAHSIPAPGAKGSHGYWVKRGDASAQTSRDVVFAEDDIELERVKADFQSRGIHDVVVSAHVPGDLVKFYGVGENFFHTCYPTADGVTKFGDERRNGVPHYYSFDRQLLHDTVVRLSALVDVPVFGGDCIVTPQGDFKIIDFNDWPSFSRCREEAADAIVSLVGQRIAKKQKQIDNE